MKDLMEMIYKLLSRYAKTSYDEISRDKDGVVILEDMKITYSLPSRLQTTDLEVRNEIPLTIDIWYRKEHIFDVEDVAYAVDKELSRLKWTCDNQVALFRRDGTFMVNINDEDPNIKRKQMNYMINYYSN